jgi:hypothetical protein
MINKDSTINTPSPQVQYRLKGKKAVSWRKDTIILTRLIAVAEIFLRGGTIISIASAFDYSFSTAKRDLARVKTLWREQSLEDLAAQRDQSIAQYRLVITKAWAEYSRKPNANFLRVIIDAQAKIDDIQGNQAPKEIHIEEPDLEAIRRKRWQDLKDVLPEVLDLGEENV